LIETEEVRIQCTDVLLKLAAVTSPIVVCVGGAGSSKSHSMAQLFAMILTEQKHKQLGILRKTFPALRLTAYQLVIDVLKELGIYERCEHNKTNHTIEYNTNTIYFRSVDDPEKLKSSNFNYIWIEEATDLTHTEYLIIRMRLNRRSLDGHKNRIYLTLNPIDANHWIATQLCGVSGEGQ